MASKTKPTTAKAATDKPKKTPKPKPPEKIFLSQIKEYDFEHVCFPKPSSKREENECYVLMSDYVCSDSGHGSGGEALGVYRSEKSAVQALLNAVQEFWTDRMEMDRDDDDDGMCKEVEESNNADPEPFFEHNEFRYTNKLYDVWTWKLTTLPFED